jgi:hypothetical protein
VTNSFIEINILNQDNRIIRYNNRLYFKYKQELPNNFLEDQMKKSILLTVCFLFFTLSGVAQFKEGDVELSLSGGFGSQSEEFTNSGKTRSESVKYFGFSIQPSYYLVDNFSIGVSLDLLAAEKQDPVRSFLFNIGYTFHISNSNLYPYGTVGYGISNSAPFPLGTVFYSATHNMDINVFTAGAGIKILLSKSILLKFELNYRNNSWTYEYKSGYYSDKTDYTYSTFGVLYGISVLL